MENKNLENKRLLIVEDSLVMNPLSVANEIPELKQSLERVVKDYETEYSHELEKYGIKLNDVAKAVPEFVGAILSGEENNFQYLNEIKESSYLLKEHFKNNPNPSILDCVSIPVKNFNKDDIRNLIIFSLEEKYRNKEIKYQNNQIEDEASNIDDEGLSFDERIELRREICQKKKKDVKWEAILSYVRNLQYYILSDRNLQDYTSEDSEVKRPEHKSLESILNNPILNKKARQSMENMFGSVFEAKLKESGVNVKVDFATDVETALEYLNSKDYDFAVTDVGVPLKSVMLNRGIGGDSLDAVSESLKQKYHEVFNEETRRETFAGEKAIPYGSYLEGHPSRLDIDLSSSKYHAGNLVTSYARKKGIPTLQYTDNGHFGRGVVSSIVANNLSEKDLYKMMDEIHDQDGYRVETKVGDFKIGSKDIDNYVKVVSDFVK